ncbi:L-histidine N(alpha)-methyltransferase [Streptomyces sp. KR55]|uniref:L-histidine N(alpha)-methyltransferase n=1 Tax=Streptomyces sp. KR55 TaxID=3457425 RepID=UPI003FD10574
MRARSDRRPDAAESRTLVPLPGLRHRRFAHAGADGFSDGLGIVQRHAEVGAGHRGRHGRGVSHEGEGLFGVSDREISDLGLTLDLAEGEDLRTELSCKFRRDILTAELKAGGFTFRHWWTDPAARFALVMAVPNPGSSPTARNCRGAPHRSREDVKSAALQTNCQIRQPVAKPLPFRRKSPTASA